MDNQIVSRIKQFMEYKSLNSLSLAKELGYNSSEKLSRLFRGGNAKPSYDIIYDISVRFEINVDWLITGRGTMQNSHSARTEELKTASSSHQTTPTEESFLYKVYKDQFEIAQKREEENRTLLTENILLKEKLHQMEAGNRSEKEAVKHAPKRSSSLQSAQNAPPTHAPSIKR